MANITGRMIALVSTWVMLLIFFVLILMGCSGAAGRYLDFWKTERSQKKSFRHDPTAKLLRDLHPGGSFMLVGPVTLKKNYEAPVLVVAVTDMFKKREIVTERILQSPVLFYQAYLPEGNYDLYFFADIDGNGYFDADEMIGQTSDTPIHVSKEGVKDGLTFYGPAFALDVENPLQTDLPLRVMVRYQDSIFASLDDPFFDPQYGEIGMYDPKKFIAHTQRSVFSLDQFDAGKTMVVFVHGVAGTPRDFKYFVEGLDKKRFQPLFYFYPSGMPLQKMASLLADILRILNENKEFHMKRAIVVAHSMGGLIGLSALNEVCRDGVPSYLKGYISFNTPYGGVEDAIKALDNAPAVLPCWRDVAPNSTFLKQLYLGPAVENIPFYLFFGYETGKSSDGTITLQSQLEQRIQFSAYKTYGFNKSHVGILSDDQARQAFYSALDALDEEEK
ncbi:MAG: alpha/beta hydrolase [Syntrophaceae bacterium]|nr:alpha/beta hydrolase [Syntrophaceae bacterium]